MRRALSICLSGTLAACGPDVESGGVTSAVASAAPSAAGRERCVAASGRSHGRTEHLPAVVVDDATRRAVAPAPANAAKSQPGPAGHFGVDQVGIVRLGVDGSMRKILSHEYRIHDLVLAPDGRTVWAGGYGGVWRIVGDQVEKVSDLSGYELAPTPDGGSNT